MVICEASSMINRSKFSIRNYAFMCLENCCSDYYRDIQNCRQIPLFAGNLGYFCLCIELLLTGHFEDIVAVFRINLITAARRLSIAAWVKAVKSTDFFCLKACNTICASSFVLPLRADLESKSAGWTPIVRKLYFAVK